MDKLPSPPLAPLSTVSHHTDARHRQAVPLCVFAHACVCVCVCVGSTNICLVTTDRLLQIHISNPHTLTQTHTRTRKHTTKENKRNCRHLLPQQHCYSAPHVYDMLMYKKGTYCFNKQIQKPSYDSEGDG